MFRVEKRSDMASWSWIWVIIQEDFSGSTREIAYMADKEIADTICRILNGAASVSVSEMDNDTA